MTFLSDSDNDRDFHDLAMGDLPRAGGEIVRASQRLEDIFQPDKINVAALAAVLRAPLPTRSLPRPMLSRSRGLL